MAIIVSKFPTENSESTRDVARYDEIVKIISYEKLSIESFRIPRLLER